jgi:hypothetical protein
MADHLDNSLTGPLSHDEPSRVHGRDGRRPGELQAERLGHAGHGRGGAHRHAVAGAARHAGLGFRQVRLGEPAGTELLGQLPDRRTGPDVAPTEFAVQHGSPGNHDRREVDTRCPHELGRRRLVAPREQHDTVERVGPDRLLDLHGHEVAVQHGGWSHDRLAERHGRKLEREAAGHQDTPFDRLGHGAQVGVARRQFRPAVGDADHGPPIEELIGEAFVADPRTMEKTLSSFRRKPVRAADSSAVHLHRGAVAHAGPGKREIRRRAGAARI